MNGKRGQIDQVITSVIVLFAVFWLMVLFVNVSANIGKVKESVFGRENEEVPAFSSSAEEASSRAMLDFFLSDDVIINNESVKVGEALTRFIELLREAPNNEVPVSEREAFLIPLEELFDEAYSCSEKNELYFVMDSAGGRMLHLDYPDRRFSKPSDGLARVIFADSDREKDSFLYALFSVEKFEDTRGYAVFKLEGNARIYVKEKVRC